MISRIWGRINSLELPIFLRKPIYHFYSFLFGCNLDEMANPNLESYPNLGEFFYRALKSDARTIASKSLTDIVSPADGKILHFGSVVGDRVEQIKGMNYSLKGLLGEYYDDEPIKIAKQPNVHSYVQDPNKSLYFVVIYLAPGDYHRFHSPTEWTVKKLRHFSGINEINIIDFY